MAGNWEKIARSHLLKSRKYWSCKVSLGIVTTTITQLNSLFGNSLIFNFNFRKELLETLCLCIYPGF